MAESSNELTTLQLAAAAAAAAKTKQQLEEEEREKMQVLVSNFSEEQLNRYEMFRRSAFPKAAIKRVNIHIVMFVLKPFL